QHAAELKAATAEAARSARQEVEQKLAQAKLKDTNQTELIAKLQASEAALRSDAVRAQQELEAKFAQDLKAATENAIKVAHRQEEQKLADGQLKEAQQAELISKLKASEATQRGDAARAQEQLKAQFAQELKAVTEKATKDANRQVEKRLADARIKETEQAE